MTPNIKYINQSAPFWDWVASFEQSAANHPFFGGAPGPNHVPEDGGPPVESWGPWGLGGPWGRRNNWHGGMPHHGGPPHDRGHHGPPPAHEHDHSGDDKQKEENVTEKEAAADPPEDVPGCSSEREGYEWHHGHDRRGRHCRGGRWARGFGRHHRPHVRGGWNMPGQGGFRLLNELFGQGGNDSGEDKDWSPEADVFDTESAFVVHVSLPGAFKEDVGVSWDQEKSELAVAGVLHRPGGEAFLKTLALDERKTGAFERKIRLGTRAVPAHVDVEGITAKLENGILLVDVPKLNGEFVEVKKVDIE